MSLGIIIQARTGSTRLPQKMLLPFYNGFSVLELLLMRLKNNISDTNIVATTTNRADDEILNIAGKHNVKCFRGDENNVLNRFINAAKENKISRIIRICADNPFLDILSLKVLIEKFSMSSCDYMSFSTSEGIPTIKTHYGFWAEAVTLEALEKVSELTNEKLYHEHVTNYIYTHKANFKCQFIEIDSEVEQMRIRLTLDTLSDFEMQKEIYSVLVETNNEFSIKHVIDLLNKHPKFFEIMDEQIQLNSK